MKTTRYFDQVVLRKRPYLRKEWCEQIILRAMHVEIQPDGRIRYWGKIPEYSTKFLRVITLEDGRTIHNAFLDRGFKQEDN